MDLRRRQLSVPEAHTARAVSEVLYVAQRPETKRLAHTMVIEQAAPREPQ